jgi:hypothetical protein
MAKTFKPILLSLLFVSSICFGQKKNDWQKNGLKGRVKSITTTVYNATEKFGEPVKGEIKEKSEIVTIQFDTKGNDNTILQKEAVYRLQIRHKRE